MKNIELEKDLEKIYALAEEVERVAIVDIEEVKTLVDKGFDSDNARGIISLISMVQGSLIQVSNNFKKY
ncbi:MAG: hypothetical protein E7262_07180 [Lachnospiraceae bacterium]|nr:hypothetical protein [Lachnospiraceae bacterium]